MGFRYCVGFTRFGDLQYISEFLFFYDLGEGGFKGLRVKGLFLSFPLILFLASMLVCVLHWPK